MTLLHIGADADGKECCEGSPHPPPSGRRLERRGAEPRFREGVDLGDPQAAARFLEGAVDDAVMERADELGVGSGEIVEGTAVHADGRAVGLRVEALLIQELNDPLDRRPVVGRLGGARLVVEVAAPARPEA